MNPGKAIGHENLERVRAWFASHLGGTNVECAKALGLGPMAVGRHVQTLRSAWPSREAAPSDALRERAESIRRIWKNAYGRDLNCDPKHGSALEYGRAQGLDMAADYLASLSPSTGGAQATSEAAAALILARYAQVNGYDSFAWKGSVQAPGEETERFQVTAVLTPGGAQGQDEVRS